MTFAEYPLFESSFIYARELAQMESQQHPYHFIYLFKNNSGMYIVDHLGLRNDDERLIFTFKNGNKV